MCLHISSRLTLRWPAALAARPRFCTSSRSLANSAMHGGAPPPPPNGEAMAGTPIGDMAGAGADEAGGARSPVPADADGAARGETVGHGSVWAAAWHAGSMIAAITRGKR